MQDAEYDCHRARHDSIDAAASTIGVDLTIAVEKIGYEIILKTYPDFSKLVTLLNAIREKIAQSRKNRGSRAQIYSEMEDNEFLDLLEAYRVFQTSEPIMKEMARKQRWRNLVNTLFGVAGMIGLAITIFTVFN